MNVLHLGKFYPPARGGMETMLALICGKTEGRVHNRALVANDEHASVGETRDGVEVMRAGAWKRFGARPRSRPSPTR